MIVDTKISELPLMSGSSIDETTYIPVVTGTFPVNRKLPVKDIMITTFETDPIYTSEKDTLALKTDLDNYSLTGHTHNQYLESETDPIYTSEKDTLALKTDLDNYSLTGHTHNQYLESETDPIYTSEKDTLALKTDLDNYSLTGHTHSQYLESETDPIYTSEKDTLALKTDLDNYSLTGHTHSQYLESETDPIYTSEKDTLALKTDLDNYSLTGHTHSQYLESETDPIYTSEKDTLALKTDLDNYSLTGHTHSQYLESETDPIYTSEKDTLALKTDLDNYSLTGHTHYELYSPTGGTATVYVDNGGNLHIDADIYQNGSGYTTHTEQLYTKKDYIYLREDSTTGLSTGEYTGFEAINYDGVNNGRLVFDNTGTARVGDLGFEQPLSTREETPIDNGVAIWDNDTVRFITSTGLTFDNTDLKVNGINVSLTGHIHSQYLETETDPIYTSEKNTLALKTDLDNYSLTGHTHFQYLESETDPIYTSEKNTLALKTDLDNYSLTGHTHSEYITGYTAGDNITIENGIISSTGGGGPSMGISTQNGTTYTLDIDDAFSIIKFDNENSIEVTIPTESSVNFDIPTQIDILQYNLGAVTVKGADGVILLSSETGFTTNGRYTTVSIIKTGTDTWNLFGADDMTYTAGDGISIVDNVISVTGSTGGSSLWTSLTGTRVSDTTFTVGSDITSYVAKGMVFKWTESSVVKVGMVSIPSTYSNPNTTVTIIGDTMSSIDEGSLKYCMLGVEMFQKNFAYAGTIGSVSTNVMNTYYATEPMIVLGCDLQVGTSGETNSTTIDINKGGTSMFTTKPTLGSTVETSSTPFTADNNTSLALNDKVTIDIDAVQTTPAIDMYVQLYVFPTRYLNLN